MQKQQFIATWNPARGVWETEQPNLLCAHLEVYLEVWQQSGITLNGKAYALPTLAQLTGVSASSLLRTPSVTDSTGGAISEKQARERGRMVKIADQAAELAFMNGLPVSPKIAKSLLPTPKARDHQAEGYEAGLRRSQPQLGTTVVALERGDLLPTPTIGHIRNYDEPIEDYEDRKAKGVSGEYRGIPGISLGVAVRMDLLPTPVASEGTKAPAQQTSETKSKTGQVWLSNVAKDIELMGTPRTSSKNAATEKQIEAGAPKSRIEDQVLTDTWGRFGPAIERWAKVIGRPAPPATKPDGKDGAHRLSAEFTEWLMGLPDGWITGVGLSRNEALKACGNGVVPQQAELALRLLLENTTIKGINK